MVSQVNAQENINYQKPPEEILELVDIQRAPGILIDEKNEYMMLISRSTYKLIEELSQEELRLGGLRINPNTNIGSRATFYEKIQVKNIKIQVGLYKMSTVYLKTLNSLISPGRLTRKR